LKASANLFGVRLSGIRINFYNTNANRQWSLS
jgi:hypothetical protein